MSASKENGLHGGYGERLLPVVIDNLARTTPDQIHSIMSRSAHSYSEGTMTVTYAKLANAINRLAWFLHENRLKIAGSETLSYIGPNDIRYMAIVVAGMKIGQKILLPSPSNSISNHLNLIDKTHCGVILKDKSSNVDHIVSACPTPLEVIDIPDFDPLFDDKDAKPYPWNPCFESVKNTPVFVQHSSGSTGQVKPILYTHGSLACLDKQHFLEQGPHCQSFFAFLSHGRRSIYNPMPLFHGIALLMGLVGAVFHQYTYLMAPSAEKPTKERTLQHLDILKPQVCLIAPSTLEEMTEDPKALGVLGKCDAIMFGGGPLSDYAAGVVSKHMRLQTGFGSTEAGIYPICMLEDYENDYHYYRFVTGAVPEHGGMDFRPIGDGTYQLFLVRNNGVEWSSIFHAFPDKDEYDTSDVWRKHPTKEGLWKHVGRSDDVIVLSNGKKVSPSTAESILHGCPELREVVLAGSGRFQVALIIELEESAQKLDRGEILRRLDPFLKKTNREMPAHAQLSADYVILATPEKPLSRAPKGTLARNETLRSFQKELELLYGGVADSNVAISSAPLLKGADKKTTLKGLTALFERVLEIPQLPPNQSYLASGVDSLKAIWLVRNIRAQLKAEGAAINTNDINNSLIYSNQTLWQLTDSLHKLRSSTKASLQTNTAIQVMLAEFIGRLPVRKTQTAPLRKSNLTVALTGSTGSLGCYLLANLLQNPTVSKVYALNHSEGGQTRQAAAFKARNLPADFGERVSFQHVDLSQPQFGLEAAIYDQMVDEVDVFLHNAWPVDWNMPLEAFRSQIAGVGNIIKLAVNAPNSPAILFTSSVATAVGWADLNPNQAVPEHVVDDTRAIGFNGYSQSKWVAERLLAEAGMISGTRSANVRVGQLAGSVTGTSVWKREEWFPSIIYSSAHLGILPKSLGKFSGIDFVPLESAAGILLDLVFDAAGRSDVDPNVVYNMVNPAPVPFHDLTPAIAEAIQKKTGKDVELVDYDEWVRRLKESSESTSSEQMVNPGIKLLDFFESLVPINAEQAERKGFATEETLAHSATMKTLQPVNVAWVEKWLRGLGF